VEHHTVEVRGTEGGGTSGDASARFLRELRQLRDFAGLEQVELAARAHYPHDYIRAAETGPALPDLPLLAAYVRGCGGTTEEWEERWRVLTNAPALTLLPIRSAGASTAASAGSRIGLAFQAADVPDPAAVMAALNRVAEKIAADTASPARSPRATPPPTAAVPTAAVPRPPAKPDLAAAPGAATSKSTSAASASAAPTTAGTGTTADTGTTAGTDTTAGTGTPPAVTARVGRSFSMTSRTTIAALIALAICVIVAVLAIVT
jgi:hypothetical protein